MLNDNGDTPKIWKSPEEILAEQQETSKNLVVPEEPEVPTLPVEERLSIIENEASENDKDILNALVEVSKTANVLKKIDNEELQDGRSKVLKAWYDAFIQSKMQNSHTLEKVISGLADKLLANIDNIDLETAGNLIEKFANVNAIMAQRNPTTFGDPGYSGGNGPLVNLTLNNATAEGASINNPTVNIGNQPPVQNLETLNTLSSNIKSWGNAPKKVKPIIEAETVGSK